MRRLFAILIVGMNIGGCSMMGHHTHLTPLPASSTWTVRYPSQPLLGSTYNLKRGKLHACTTYTGFQGLTGPILVPFLPEGAIGPRLNFQLIGI